MRTQVQSPGHLGKSWMWECTHIILALGRQDMRLNGLCGSMVSAAQWSAQPNWKSPDPSGRTWLPSDLHLHKDLHTHLYIPLPNTYPMRKSGLLLSPRDRDYVFIACQSCLRVLLCAGSPSRSFHCSSAYPLSRDEGS